MASDYIKNIILDEKNNKIIADIADGNVYPLTFMKQKELYSHYKSYEEKYGAFICGLVSGTLRCANESNKLAKLETSKANFFKFKDSNVTDILNEIIKSLKK